MSMTTTNEARTAADVMNASPRTCSRFSQIIEVVMIFKDEDCGMVPVVDDGKPLGVVTDRDVALALSRWPTDLTQRSVEEIMSRDPVIVSAHAPLSEVLDTFGRELVRRLLVVDDEALLVGVISWKDVSNEANDRQVGEVVSEVVEAPGSRASDEER